MRKAIALIVLYIIENYKDSPLRTALIVLWIEQLEILYNPEKHPDYTDLSIHKSKKHLTSQVLTCKLLGADWVEITHEMAKIEADLSQILKDMDEKHPLSPEDKKDVAETCALMYTQSQLGSGLMGLLNILKSSK
jgi:hypothetical protein